MKEDRILVFDKSKSQKLTNIPRVQFPNNILVSDFTKNLTEYRKIVNSIIRKNHTDDAQIKKSLKDFNASIDLNREYEEISFGEAAGILETVTENLETMFTYLQNARDLSWREFQMLTTEVMRPVMLNDPSKRGVAPEI